MSDTVLTHFSDADPAAVELLQTIASDKVPKLIEFLPSIFHGEAERTFSPLWSLLLAMEENFGSFDRIIDNIDRYFDVEKAPDGSGDGREDFLDWLGSWVGMVPEHDWPEEKKRYIIRQASQLYHYRGTLISLSYMIALFFDIHVEIKEWEWPQAMQIGVNNTIGVNTHLVGMPNINHCFILIWKPMNYSDQTQLNNRIKQIRALIDREKPAHTRCYLQIGPDESNEKITREINTETPISEGANQ